MITIDGGTGKITHSGANVAPKMMFDRWRLTGAGSSFHGAYMGDGFLSFNTEFSNPTGYYISTFTNSLVAGPMQLGSTLTIDGNFTIVQEES